MSPGHERNHSPSGDAPRPGGGTYPVRAAVSARHPEADPEPPRPTPTPRPFVPQTAHGSPRALVTLILIGFALVTLVLLAFSVSGYLPDADQTVGPEPDQAPAAEAPDS